MCRRDLELGLETRRRGETRTEVLLDEGTHRGPGAQSSPVQLPLSHRGGGLTTKVKRLGDKAR